MRSFLKHNFWLFLLHLKKHSREIEKKIEESYVRCKYKIPRLFEPVATTTPYITQRHSKHTAFFSLLYYDTDCMADLHGFKADTGGVTTKLITISLEIHIYNLISTHGQVQHMFKMSSSVFFLLCDP